MVVAHHDKFGLVVSRFWHLSGSESLVSDNRTTIPSSGRHRGISSKGFVVDWRKVTRDNFRQYGAWQMEQLNKLEKEYEDTGNRLAFPLAS